MARCAVFKSINFGRNVSEDEIMATSEEGSQIYAGKEHELIESYKKNELLDNGFSSNLNTVLHLG